MKRAPLTLVTLLFAAGCGRKLDPQPPILVVPARPAPLDVSQDGSDVVVRFPFPTMTSEGVPLSGLRKVTLYREVRAAGEGARPSPPAAGGDAREREEKEFRSRAEVIAEIGRDEMDQWTVGGDLLYRDSLLPLFREKRLGRVLLRYGVTATRGKRLTSEMSPIQGIVPALPPGRPLFLRSTVEETRVCLEWLPPEEMLDGARPAVVTGYAVYRKERGEEWYEKWIGLAKEQTSYVDDSARPDHVYLYTVRATPVWQLPPILGPAADEILVDTKDVFPPPPPDGFLVLLEPDGARLVWNPVLAADLAGYRVYRMEPEATSWTKVTDGLSETLWFDKGSRPGTRYAVAAVDRSGNESPLSEQRK